ncbi:hypothetical protein V6N13_001314 [Hibiscus sabdariffa]|uniref:Jasmonate O-methyltransferase n=1 Tax=Hibiscus sabdariffa TaxID=183260 RepID=A0ABR2G873_9ROSI
MQALHMNKGNGDTSYAKNSTVQSKIISVGKRVMQEAILKMIDSNVVDLESMGIADLGCSSGPNTLFVISKIMDTVEAANRRLGRRLVSELRVFLNDLYSNDFNEIVPYQQPAFRAFFFQSSLALTG